MEIREFRRPVEVRKEPRPHNPHLIKVRESVHHLRNGHFDSREEISERVMDEIALEIEVVFRVEQREQARLSVQSEAAWNGVAQYTKIVALTQRLVRQAVAGKDFEFADQGEVVLKGLDEPVRAWAVEWT